MRKCRSRIRRPATERYPLAECYSITKEWNTPGVTLSDSVLIEGLAVETVVGVYDWELTPGSEFGYHEKQPDRNMHMRLYQFIRTCEELELKVCLGEQSMQYTLFKRMGN